MANKAKAVQKLRKPQSRLDGSARLKATAKAVGSKLEFETRAWLGFFLGTGHPKTLGPMGFAWENDHTHDNTWENDGNIP